MPRTLIMVLFFVCQFMACDVTTAQPSLANEPSANRLALLVGIDEYQYSSVNDLNGAANDVAIMKSMLMEQFGFSEMSVKTLTNEQATRTAILDAINNHLIARAKEMSDPIIVFHYSGHGSQIKDTNGDEIDGRDETLVPHDSGRNEDPNNDISDDEINDALAKLTAITPYVTFIFDSCHSGSATRGSGAARTVAPDLRDLAPYVEDTSRTIATAQGKNDLRGGNDGYVLISGSGAQELSREYSVEGKTYGAFTWHLTQQIRNTGGEATYTDVMDLVRRQVSSLYPSQHPQLEGSGRDRFVFGTKSSAADPYISASPASGVNVRLEAGQAQGVTVGSVYDVFAPGTHNQEQAARIAQVKVSSIDVVRSVAEITDGGQVPKASRAIEREHMYPDAVLKVYISPEDSDRSEVLVSLEQKLRDHAQIELLGEKAGYDLRILEVQDEAGKRFIATEGGDPTEISLRVPVTDNDAAERVVKQVLHWAKWFNTQRIKNETSDLSIAFEIAGKGGNAGPASNESSLSFRAGEHITFTVRNNSAEPVFIAVLYLSSDGSMDVVYPRRGQQESIGPTKTWSQTFKGFVPGGKSSIRDIVKIIGTSSYADFSFLGQDAVPRGTPLATRGGRNRNALEQLLGQGVLGTTRGLKSIETDQWVTAEKVIEIRTTQ